MLPCDPSRKYWTIAGSENVHGGVRRRVVLSGGAGFSPKNKGERKRKTVRGDIITDEIAQINMKIVERPSKSAESKPEQPAK